MHGAAPAIYRFTREFLNSVRELISCLGAFRARQLLGGRRRRKTAGLRPVKLSPAANGPGIAAKIARGAEPPKAPKRVFRPARIRSPRSRRSGLESFKLENKSSLETAKGRGTAPRASRPDSVVSGSARKFIRAVRHMSSDLARTPQRSSAGESTRRTIRARPGPRFGHFGTRRPSPERPKPRSPLQCSCRRRPRPRRRCI